MSDKRNPLAISQQRVWSDGNSVIRINIVAASPCNETRQHHHFNSALLKWVNK
jgi:hypothetical protein